MAAQKASLEQLANLATIDVDDTEGWEEMEDDDEDVAGAAAAHASTTEDGAHVMVQPETVALVGLGRKADCHLRRPLFHGSAVY